MDDMSKATTALNSASHKTTSIEPPLKRTKITDQAPTVSPPPSSSSSDLSNAPPTSPTSPVFQTPLSKTPLSSSSSSHATCCNHPSFKSPLSKSGIRNLLKTEANYDCDNPGNTQKRANYLAWDDYFMAVASLSSQRSKDPNTPTGACIVDDENRITGIGYNGMPRGCSDDMLPWNMNDARNSPNTTTTTTPPPPPSILHTRDPFCVPAEVNAILNKCSADVAGSRMYVAHFPCNECAKVIVQSKLSEVIYMQHTSPNEDKYKASRILFEMAGIKTRQHIPEVPYVNLNFQSAMPSQEMAAAIPQEDDEREAAMIPKILNPEDNPKHDTKLKELLLREANYDPTQTPTTKRTNYLSWDDYFMAMAFLTARRSKDPNTQVGACIVDSDKRIIGVGYNGFPRYCSDDHLPWARDSSLPDLHKKYFYVVHAECNAILNKCSHSVKGATLYVALFPCHDCAKIIIQSGIAEVVYLSDQYHDTDSTRASRIMFQMAGVQLRQHIPHSHVVDIPLTASQRRLSSTEDHNDKDTTTTDDTK